MKSNVLESLPFAEGSFDYVHHRLLRAGIPLRHWPNVVEGLVRVTRPGGWVELLETAPQLEPESPAIGRAYELFRKVGRAAGHDTLGRLEANLERWLVAAGPRPCRRGW